MPVGVQLAWRLRALILSGGLSAGERLPGVRELAAGAGVNVNTARAIYRRLEEESLAVSRHGLGTFVADDAKVRPVLELLAAEAVEAARASGISPRDLARALYVGTAPGTGNRSPVDLDQAPTQGDQLGARRTLRSQVARLETELAALTEYLDPEDDAPAVPGAAPHVADLGELEQVRDRLIMRLRRARGAAEARGVREQSARARLDEMIADPAAHRWSSVSSEEMGEPGCARYEVEPAWGPVGALMNWWRVRVSGGCPLPAPREAVGE